MGFMSYYLWSHASTTVIVLAVGFCGHSVSIDQFIMV